MNSLPSEHIALLVIDVQVGLFCSETPPFEAVDVVRRINAVGAKARAAGRPVIFIQHDGPADGDWLVPFSKGWELHPDLERAPGETIIRKTTGDAFYRTTLEKELRSRGIESLVLTGYATDFCIDATLRNAASKDFKVFVVADAHTTNDTKVLKADLIRQHFNAVWADSSSSRGIHVLNAREVQFSST